MMKEAVHLWVLQKLRSSIGLKPEYQAIAAILKSHAANTDIKSGKALHAHVLKVGHGACHLVSKALLNMYAKCKLLDDCEKLFAQINPKDTVMWNIILSGFSDCRNNDTEVMRLFSEMHLNGLQKPNSVTVAIILPGCARLGELDAGKSVHSYVEKSGLDSHTLVGNALVSMYAKLGHACDDAYKVFERIPDKDVVSWNAMIAGFAESNFRIYAFELFLQMIEGQTCPNYATIANILPICAFMEISEVYRLGQEIHCYVLRRPELLANISVINALVSFYLRIGRLEEAELLFQLMDTRDLVSWNSVISGYIMNGKWVKALQVLYEFIDEEITPDSVTLVSVLPACVHLDNLKMGKQIHGYIIRHHPLNEDITVGNALISFYSKCGDVDAAFRGFLSNCRRDLISWNTMLDGFFKSQLDSQFVGLLRLMFEERIRPDSITLLTIIQYYGSIFSVDKVKEAHGFSMKHNLMRVDIEPILSNALLDAYAKCGYIDYTRKIFDGCSMLEGNVTTWNLMIRAYAENDCPDEAISLYHKLINSGMKLNAMTIMGFLPIFAHAGSVQMLRQCHGLVVRACFEDVRLKAAMLDVYSKCGNICSAYKLFESSHPKDVVIFTSMIGGYAMHGMGEEALVVFSHMLSMGVKPDHVIITAVLSACGHAGLVDEGLKIFYSMEMEYGIKPTMEHYACVVDLLARGGRINDAYCFVTKLPTEANASVWGALLGACRIHHQVEMGQVVADHLFKNKASDIGNYVLLSNLYAADAKWDSVLEIRRLMRMRDLKKPAGCSWIDVEKRNNIFVAGDCSHPQRSIIYNALSVLDQQIKEPFEF